MYVVGNKLFKEFVNDGMFDPSNFIIIYGHKNHGKTHLTRHLANAYGLTYIQLDNKVATVRELVESSRFKNNCLYHFKDFDKANGAAKSALLKLSEETPEGIKIVITTSSLNIVDTLKSRAFSFPVGYYGDKEIEEYANLTKFESHTLDRLKKLMVIMTPTLINKYRERDDLVAIIEMVEEVVEKLLNNTLALEDISRISGNFWKDDRDKLEIFLHLLSRGCLRITPDGMFIATKIQQTMHELENTAISNYKLLINDMLMEVI